MMCPRNLLPITLLAALVSLPAISGCNSAEDPETASTEAAQTAQPAEKGWQEEFGPYRPVTNWPKGLPDGPDGVKHEGWTWGSVGATYAESPDRIWITQRGELPLPPGAKPWTPYGLLQPSRGNSTGNSDGLNATCGPEEKRGFERRWHHVIFVVNGQGDLVQQWPQHDKLFSDPERCGRGPHKIRMSPYDPEKHVWIVDDQLHVIHKFTYDGQLVMTLGTLGKKGRDAGKLFDRPTDIAWLPDGTFFISDGYSGKRVAKFDKDGKFLLDWGSAPADPANPGPSEFNTPHAIAVGADRKVYVADRGHGRIQIFDENGKFLEMWPVRRPLDILMSADQQNLWVTDLDAKKMLKFDLNGKFLYAWGSAGRFPGAFDCGHQMTADQDGNLYIADCFMGRTQKFELKPNQDPAKVVTMQHPPSTS